jgi:hypothetical protein
VVTRRARATFFRARYERIVQAVEVPVLVLPEA